MRLNAILVLSPAFHTLTLYQTSSYPDPAHATLSSSNSSPSPLHVPAKSREQSMNPGVFVSVDAVDGSVHRIKQYRQTSSPFAPCRSSAWPQTALYGRHDREMQDVTNKPLPARTRPATRLQLQSRAARPAHRARKADVPVPAAFCLLEVCGASGRLRGSCSMLQAAIPPCRRGRRAQ